MIWLQHDQSENKNFLCLHYLSCLCLFGAFWYDVRRPTYLRCDKRISLITILHCNGADKNSFNIQIDRNRFKKKKGRKSGRKASKERDRYTYRVREGERERVVVVVGRERWKMCHRNSKVCFRPHSHKRQFSKDFLVGFIEAHICQLFSCPKSKQCNF